MKNRDYAYVTMTLHDALLEYPNLLENLVLETQDMTDKFIKIFKARYDYYEIGAETIGLFQRFIENKFNEYKDYYIELINAYEKELNYEDGILNDEEYTYVYTDDTDTSRVNKFIDLPNHSSSGQYVSNEEDLKTDFLSNRKGNNHLIRKGNVNVLEQRKQYLEYIRNLYLEFVERFSTCFATIYA